MSLEQLANRLREHVQALATTQRMPGTDAHRRAAEYIRKHLQQGGFSVEDVLFPGPGVRGRNVVTRPIPEPSPLPRVIIGAHYYTIPGSPGADDKASAVAALLELLV